MWLPSSQPLHQNPILSLSGHKDSLMLLYCISVIYKANTSKVYKRTAVYVCSTASCVMWGGDLPETHTKSDQMARMSWSIPPAVTALHFKQFPSLHLLSLSHCLNCHTNIHTHTNKSGRRYAQLALCCISHRPVNLSYEYFEFGGPHWLCLHGQQ